jgi:hypothetical protein
MQSNSFNYSNSLSKSVLDNHGLNKDIVNDIIYNPEFKDLKFISWNGKELINKNILPENYRTCKNIVITKNLSKEYFDCITNYQESKISLNNEIIVFII